MFLYKAQTLLFLTCVAVPVIQALNQASMDFITNQLTTMFNNNNSMVAGMIRLSFHDCVGNACDGCINYGNPGNAGLKRHILRAEDYYNNILSQGISLSRADFWAMAGAQAVYHSSPKRQCNDCPLVPVPNIVHKTGRVDCPGSPWGQEDPALPNKLWGTPQVLQYFSNMFGFNAKETTAIMGAHTLGQGHAELTDSGMIHPWAKEEYEFNNFFYMDLLDQDLGWKQRIVGGEDQTYIWESEPFQGEQRYLLLNSDMALVKDQGVIDLNGQVSCTYSTCPDAPQATLSWAMAFSDDNALFIQEFSKAFQKMIGHGYSSLNDITP